MSGDWLDPASVTDAGAYLARLVRLDPVALVRLRPAGDGEVALWARLPFEVLVTRRVRATLTDDATVRAADLLAALATRSGLLPARHDAAWRWSVPSTSGHVVERLPAADVRRLGAAAETTLREASAGGVGGRAVGERVLRDALLDHVPVVVITDGGTRIEVSQRLVQAVVRMGFVGTGIGDESTGDEVKVRVAGGWVGLAGPFGSAWRRPSATLGVRPAR